jgi:Uma2 family endonuclease
MPAVTSSIKTLADLLNRLGGIPPDRIRFRPFPGTATIQVPGRKCPTSPVPRLAPDLAVEVLSRSNTAGEMAAKRQDYFSAGVQLVWEIDPAARVVTVYESLMQFKKLGPGDSLEGGTILLGFTLTLSDLFAELERQG